MSQDRQAFEAHMTELHRCITCPMDEQEQANSIARLCLASPVQEEAQEAQETASGAVEVWPGTTAPRNQPIWPGVGFSFEVEWSSFGASNAQSAAASRNVQKRREEGTDNTVFKGLSQKSDERNGLLPPARMMARNRSKK